jgi:hypothetical protein
MAKRINVIANSCSSGIAHLKVYALTPDNNLLFACGRPYFEKPPLASFGR